MDPLDFKPQMQEAKRMPRHYYGDTVRILFMVAGGILLGLSPSHPELLPFSPLAITLAVLFVAIFAGITNPKQFWIVVVDTVVSALGLAVFEYFAVESYRSGVPVGNIIFLAQQLLALVFFFALYYSSKSLRGMLVK